MIRYIKKFKLFFAVALVLTVATNALLVGSNVLQQNLIDSVSAMNRELVVRYTVIFISYRALVGVLFLLSQVSRDLFADKLMGEMRRQVFAGVMRRNRRDFSAVNSADYVSALTNDLRTIRQGYVSVFFMIFLAGAAVLVSLVLMVYYQPLLALVAVVFAGSMIAAPVLLGEKIAGMEKARSQTMAKWTALISDCFAGFEVIASFGMKKHIDEKFRECTEELKKNEYRADGLGAVSHGFAQLLSALAQAGLLGISCFMVLSGKMTLGALVVYASLNGNFCSNLSTLYQIIPMIKGMKPVIARINGFVDYETDSGEGTVCRVPMEQRLPSLEQCLEVKDLSFGYEEGKDILRNLSLTLEAGKKYAMVGESGSGKTTLIRLLTGDFCDYRGGIYYDGVELGELEKEKLCTVASVIHQEVFLFDDTIRNNICLFEEFSEEQLEKALARSGVKKFLDFFPEGLDYSVGQRGERLSGGQRQRIAIARALIRNTKFLILDEGTSALDAETAADIEKELLAMPELTVLTITHHLRNPKEYDGVLELGA